MNKIVGWLILVTFVIGNLGWIFFTEWGLRAWLMWQLFAFCVAVLVNAEAIKKILFNKKKK